MKFLRLKKRSPIEAFVYLLFICVHNFISALEKAQPHWSVKNIVKEIADYFDFCAWKSAAPLKRRKEIIKKINWILDFCAWKSAAPLKQSIVILIASPIATISALEKAQPHWSSFSLFSYQPHLDHFCAWKSAAPLKQGNFVCFSVNVVHFCAWKSAAPLKLIYVICCRLDGL